MHELKQEQLLYDIIRTAGSYPTKLLIREEICFVVAIDLSWISPDLKSQSFLALKALYLTNFTLVLELEWNLNSKTNFFCWGVLSFSGFCEVMPVVLHGYTRSKSLHFKPGIIFWNVSCCPRFTAIPCLSHLSFC